MKKPPIILGLLLGGICISNALIAAINASDHMNLSGYTGYGDCKGCHNGSFGPSFQQHVDDLMASVHWTWAKDDGYNTSEVGKINDINNFCVAVESNEPRCTSCHIGIGWTDNTFDLDVANNIDCFICHDGTGQYSKNPKGAGVPNPLPEGVTYTDIVQSFQLPDRDNCGVCHFNGGGGEGVKHGTMDGSLSMPNRDLDVHMGGIADMTCIDCHRKAGRVSTTADFFGTRYSHQDGVNDATLCKDCHTNASTVHSSTLAGHFDKIACQTCHVPALARGGKPTKLFWDWSTAGNRIDNGDGTFAQRKITNDQGWVIYDSMKGDFIWGENVIPEYTWSNGKIAHLTTDNMPTNPNGVTKINTLAGSEGDGLIFPAKIFRGIQPADAGAGTLAVPNLFPGGTNSAEDTTGAKNAYWAGYDWEKAVISGQQAAGNTWIGPLEWVETDYTWIASHMVAPKEQALRCVECHNSFGRLDFAALGLSASKQTWMDDEVWAGYILEDGPYFDTGDWLGEIYVSATTKPWIYVFDMSQWFYMPQEAIMNDGSWAFVPMM